MSFLAAVELEQASYAWLSDDHNPELEWAYDVIVSNSEKGVHVFHATVKACGYPVATV